MPRFTGRFFSGLAVWMTGPGLLIGACYPFLAVFLGLGANEVFTCLQ